MRETHHRTAEAFDEDDIHYQICFKGTAVITNNQINCKISPTSGRSEIHSQKKREMIQCSHRLREGHQPFQKKGVDKMKTLIIAEFHTDTVYILIVTKQSSEGTALHYQKAA